MSDTGTTPPVQVTLRRVREANKVGAVETVFGLSGDEMRRLLAEDEEEDRDIFEEMFGPSFRCVSGGPDSVAEAGARSQGHSPPHEGEEMKKPKRRPESVWAWGYQFKRDGRWRLGYTACAAKSIADARYGGSEIYRVVPVWIVRGRKP